jgi:LPXTG-site transpeptidase (sortase) family protein
MGQKRIKIYRILLYILIAVGFGLIFWPVYTNFIASRGMSEELTEWEEESLEDSGEEIISTEKDPELETEAVDADQVGSEDAEDNPVMEMIQDGPDIEIQSELTAEDFFPMKITIPKIELEYLVLEGTDSVTLKKGAGHESVTPLPGEEGRCTISGHRTTYGAPFNRVDELEEGDLIYLESLDNKFYVYSVTALEVVKPTDVWILEGTEKEELLLTTCHPKYSAATRLIIISELVELFNFEIDT